MDSMMKAPPNNQPAFNEFKAQLAMNSNVAPLNSVPNKTYKLMNSAERGEINTHNLVICSQHAEKGKISKSPCTCAKQSAIRDPSGGVSGGF